MGTNPVKPNQKILRSALKEALKDLPLKRTHLRFIVRSFDISFVGHENAPERGTGEAYIFHPLRAAIACAEAMVNLSICDWKLIAEILLHDCFEDAEAGMKSPLLLKSSVLFWLGVEVTFDVLCLTKDKEKGEDHYWVKQLLHSERWRPLAGKFSDRIDNQETLSGLSSEKQQVKILETELRFPPLYERLCHLIQHEVDAGRLERGWLQFPPALNWKLLSATKKAKKHLVSLPPP